MSKKFLMIQGMLYVAHKCPSFIHVKLLKITVFFFSSLLCRIINLPFADYLTYHRLQPSLSRARMQTLPTCETLAQLIATLDNPIYSCITAVDNIENILYQGSKLAQDGSLVCLFMSKACADFLRFLPTVFISLASVLIAGQQYKVGFVVPHLSDSIPLQLNAPTNFYFIIGYLLVYLDMCYQWEMGQDCESFRTTLPYFFFIHSIKLKKF